MQVQKLSKFVDFTKACAESGLSKDLGGYWGAFAQDGRQKESNAGWFFSLRVISVGGKFWKRCCERLSRSLVRCRAT
jgi:hypothetical protein